MSLRSLDPALTIASVRKYGKGKKIEKRGGDTNDRKGRGDMMVTVKLRGDGEVEREERRRGRRKEVKGRKGKERKGTQAIEDGPREEPILKAVVARQDLGAAGTEFERSDRLPLSIIISLFPLRAFSLPVPLLPLLFQSQSPWCSRHFLPLFFLIFTPFVGAKEGSWSDFCFVRCFSRSAFLVACVTRSMKSTQSVIN
jgi:hypothetical protein